MKQKLFMGKFACRIDSYVLRVTKKFRLPARHADGYKISH